MSIRVVIAVSVTCLAALVLSSTLSGQAWNSHGMLAGDKPLPAGPALKHDLAGLWDAGGPGIAPRGSPTAPFTAWGEQRAQQYKPGLGPREVSLKEINDPLSTMCEPAGFPRQVLFELRPFQVLQTPSQVLILYMFEKRWRVIWTDGRALPSNPEPRWYGYSVGHWADDYTFVVQTNGMDERTWLDNAGNPHSSDLRVEERYQRIDESTLELTITIDDPTAYTKPWLARNKLTLRRIPPSTDLMEMICSPSAAQAYRAAMAR